MLGPSQQMNHVAQVGFETVPVMNREEFRVLGVLEKVMAEQRGGFRLMAQTSLGEVMASILSRIPNIRQMSR